MQRVIDQGETRLIVKDHEFRGGTYVDARKYIKGKDGDWVPTKKGLTVHVEILTKLIEHLQVFVDEDTQASGGSE